MKIFLQVLIFYFFFTQTINAQQEFQINAAPLWMKSISFDANNNFRHQLNNAQSGQRLGKTNGVVMVLDSNYTWDDWDAINSKFKAQASSRMATVGYDANNRIITSIGQNWDGTKWVNDIKNFFTYNANGKYATHSSQNWNGSAWVDFDKNTYTYDTKNNLTNIVYQNWGGTSWADKYRIAYTFDINNNEVSYLSENWNGTAWINSIKETYTYNTDNNMTVYLSQSWSGTAWVNSLNVLYTYNGIKKVATKTYQNWSTSWTNASRDTNTYDANQNLWTQLRQDWINSQWKDIDRYTYLYNNNHNQTSYTQVILNGTSWLNAAKASFTYDMNNFMISSVYKLYNSAGTTITIADSNYSYFHTAVSGINQRLNSENGIRIYPNPLTSQTLFSFTDGIENGLLKLFDMQGNEVRSLTFSGDQVVLAKEDLKSGLYYLRITGKNDELTTRKIIIE